MASLLSTLAAPLLLLVAACAVPQGSVQEEGTRAPERRPPAPAPGEIVDAQAAARADAEAEDALALLAAGAEALTAADPASAAPLLQRYLALQPTSSMAHFLLGVAWLDLGRLEDARTSLLRAVELEPEDAGSLAVLARVQYELGDLEAAADVLGRVLALEPENARHWTSLALVLYDAGRWGEAYETFLAAVERDPQDASAHRGLARLYVAAGQLEQAEVSYRTALSGEPGDPALSVALGHVLRDLNRPAEAFACYGEAARLDPQNAWISANLGSVCMELGRPGRARAYFEEALEQLGEGPDVAMVQLNYGMALEILGDLDGAEQALRAALARDPDLAPAHEALGALQLDRGEPEQARLHLDAALQLSCLPADLLVELALLHEAASDWERALVVAAALLEDTGPGTQADYRRAQLRMRSKHPAVHDSAAAETLLRPLLSGPLAKHPPSWLLLTEALVEQGALESAVEALDDVLAETQPDDPVWAGVHAQHELLVARLAER